MTVLTSLRSSTDVLPVHKWNNTFTCKGAPPDNVPRELILPIVLVRDPFRWMQSICKASYDSTWDRPTRRCPTLVYNDIDRNFLESRKRKQPATNTSTVTVIAEQTHKRVVDHFDSLADMWNEWNRQYVDADYPRIMVRFEDMLFRPDEVMAQVTQCAGLPVPNPYKYRLHNGKTHGNPFNFVDAMHKYSSRSGRFEGFDAPDLDYARSVLDADLMEKFEYSYTRR